jgi:hypothetical protein
MPDIRVVLTGPPYGEPRYYGTLAWRATDAYVRHLHGGKDSRHSDGQTYLSSNASDRVVETRLPLSSVTGEHLSTISLPTALSEPSVLCGPIRPGDLVINTASVGTAPFLAVTIVSNAQLADVLGQLGATSGVSSLQTCCDKGLGQTLIVALLATSRGAV